MTFKCVSWNAKRKARDQDPTSTHPHIHTSTHPHIHTSTPSPHQTHKLDNLPYILQHNLHRMHAAITLPAYTPAAITLPAYTPAASRASEYPVYDSLILYKHSYIIYIPAAYTPSYQTKGSRAPSARARLQQALQ